MATDAEIREAQRQDARNTAQRMRDASQVPGYKPPRAATRAVPEPSSAEAREEPPVDYGAGALRGSAEEIAEQLKGQTGGTGGRRGSLDYMGHLANDDVMQKGHNTGMKPKGAVTSPETARRGFRKLGGEITSTMGKADHPSRYTDRPPVTVESPQMPLKPLRVKNPGKQ